MFPSSGRVSAEPWGAHSDGEEQAGLLGTLGWGRAGHRGTAWGLSLGREVGILEC